MIARHAGEIAAMVTAVCWAMTALAFAAAGRRIGSLQVNLLRLFMGLAFLSAASAVRRGVPLPVDASAHAWRWLALSGFFGFVFGDLCLFRAFVVLGPRLSTLVMATSPIFTIALGYAFLHERVSPWHAAGVALTLTGVAWAVLERTPAPAAGEAPPRPGTSGILLALGGSLGQAMGLVASKIGMGDYDAFAATQIRVIAGIAGFSLLFTLSGRWGRLLAALRDRRALAFTALGAFFGPFLGVTCSLLAVTLTKAGIAATIMATTPVVVIPFVVLFQRERVGAGGILGSLLAVCGVAVLFLV